MGPSDMPVRAFIENFDIILKYCCISACLELIKKNAISKYLVVSQLEKLLICVGSVGSIGQYSNLVVQYANAVPVNISPALISFPKH